MSTTSQTYSKARRHVIRADTRGHGLLGETTSFPVSRRYIEEKESSLYSSERDCGRINKVKFIECESTRLTRGLVLIGHYLSDDDNE